MIDILKQSMANKRTGDVEKVAGMLASNKAATMEQLTHVYTMMQEASVRGPGASSARGDLSRLGGLDACPNHLLRQLLVPAL